MLSSVLKEIIPNHPKGPLKIIRFSTHESLDRLAIQQQFSEWGVDVFHIGIQYQNFRDLAVADEPCLQAFAQATDHVTIELVNPIQPSDCERNLYDISKVTTEASERFLKNAVDAIVQRKNGPAALLYRDIARRNKLVARLEMLVFCCEFKVI